jgi:hypothetical protein
VEIHDEWLVRHRDLSQASMALLLGERGSFGPPGPGQPAA